MSWFKKLLGKPCPEESAQRVADGVLLARQGKLERALLAYEEAIRLDPGNALAHLNAALAKQDLYNRAVADLDAEDKKQKLLEIQQFLDAALDLAPDSHIAWRAAAHVARKQGRVVEAVRAFERTLLSAPETFEHRAEIEELLTKLRPMAERERVLADAMDLARRNEIVETMSSATLERLEAYLEDEDSRTDWFWAAGVLARHLGDNDKARRHFSACLDREKHHAHAHRELATLYMREGRVQDALSHSLEAYREDPSNPALVCNVGVCYLEVGDLEQAGEYLTLARDMDPGDPIVGRAMETWQSRAHPVGTR